MDGRETIKNIEQLLDTMLDLINKVTELNTKVELADLRIKNLEYALQKGGSSWKMA
jgi:hypothetical protein